MSRLAPHPLTAAEPDVLAWHTPTSTGFLVRNGTPAGDAFGRAWKAQAEREQAARIALYARIAAMPPLSQQLAEAAEVLPVRMGGKA